MSKLAKFNKHALYSTVIPSTEQPINYRAMVLKETMELALANNENADSGMETLYATLEKCITESVNLRTLPLYDITWLLLHIQRKASGESKHFGMRCQKCDHINDVTVDLSKVYVKNLDWVKENSVIDNGSCYIKLKSPSSDTSHLIEALTKADNKTEEYYDALFEVCARCIESIYDENDVIDAAECSLEELMEFVGQLSEDSLKKFSEFFNMMPKTVLDVIFTCDNEECNHENKIELSDLSSFF